MDPRYQLHDTSAIYSPALLFYKDLIRSNIARMIDMAGGAERLRPHVKTHKTREIARMELAAGITKHKCATIAEAEGHHPDLHLSYGSLRVDLWTHAAHGLTENDFILASKIDQIAPA